MLHIGKDFQRQFNLSRRAAIFDVLRARLALMEHLEKEKDYRIWDELVFDLFKLELLLISLRTDLF